MGIQSSGYNPTLFGEMSETQHALDGKRIYPSRGMGGPR